MNIRESIVLLLGLLFLVLAILLWQEALTLNQMNSALTNDLDTQLELTAAAEQRNGELVDAKDDALAELHKAREANKEEPVKQFYRGVYAGCLVLTKAYKLEGESQVKAYKFCQQLTVRGMQQKAHTLSYPGLDKSIEPQVDPTPVPGLPLEKS